MWLKIPKWCLNCRSYIMRHQQSNSRFLCESCYERLPAIRNETCLKCGGYHDATNCRVDWATDISRFFAIFPYEDPVKFWISGLKYSKNLIFGRALRDFVTVWFETNSIHLTDIDMVIPVPIHFISLGSRGFNQTSYLLSKQKKCVCKESIVIKKHLTAQLAGKNRQERQGILKGAFVVKGDLEAKKVLLFDDVCTTGQTLSEIAKNLIKAGAAQVDCLVLSRSMKFN